MPWRLFSALKGNIFSALGGEGYRLCIVIPSFVSRISSVHWGCSLHWRDTISALEVVQCVGRDYHQCNGGEGYRQSIVIPLFVSGISSVHWRCSFHWRDIISALGDIISALEVVQCIGREYHQCIGGRGISSVHCDTMICVGYIISALEVFIPLEGYHQCTGRYHQCLGGCSVHWKAISSVHRGERDIVSTL